MQVKRRRVLSENTLLTESTESVENDSFFLAHYTKLDWLALGLKCLLWSLLMKIAIAVEFGAVFFIFSAFMFIW